MKLLLLGLLLFALRPLAAQDPRLQARLDPGTRAGVQAVIDSAAGEGLPAEPLIQKALEGRSKGASGERIVQAVSTLAASMREVRAILGAESTGQELLAGVAALRAGAPREALRTLRALRSSRGVAIPLSVLADLVADGMQVDAASTSVLDLARERASDQEYLQLRRRTHERTAP